ncbi:hypothetical protein V8C37DRAFT_375953 [Trichoderma ceciliae]
MCPPLQRRIDFSSHTPKESGLNLHPSNISFPLPDSTVRACSGPLRLPRPLQPPLSSPPPTIHCRPSSPSGTRGRDLSRRGRCLVPALPRDSSKLVGFLCPIHPPSRSAQSLVNLFSKPHHALLYISDHAPRLTMSTVEPVVPKL